MSNSNVVKLVSQALSAINSPKCCADPIEKSAFALYQLPELLEIIRSPISGKLIAYHTSHRLHSSHSSHSSRYSSR